MGEFFWVGEYNNFIGSCCYCVSDVNEFIKCCGVLIDINVCCVNKCNVKIIGVN